MERAGSRKEGNLSGTRGSLSWVSDGRAGGFRPEFRGSLSDVGGGLREVRGTPMPTGSQRGSRGAGRVARGFLRRAQRPVAGAQRSGRQRWDKRGTKAKARSQRALLSIRT